MIKLEHLALASPEQMEFVIMGMMPVYVRITAPLYW